jgi:hypothetical protein
LRIRSEVAVDRYLGEPSGSERVFRDGWFQPGDLATLDAEGLLVISGRDKTVLTSAATRSPGGGRAGASPRSRALRRPPSQASQIGSAIMRLFAIIVGNGEIDLEALGRHCVHGFRPSSCQHISR